MKAMQAGWWFVAPAIIVIGTFFFVPVLAALAMSLTDFDLYSLLDIGNLRFVGFENYWRLLHEPLFWKTLGNTFYFVILGVPLSIGTSLAAALLVNSKVARFKNVYRTIYFAPVVTTLVAVAVVWRYLYHPRYGLINQMLGLIGLPPIDWLGDPAWATAAITILAVWRSFGYALVIYVVGLQSIPESVYEAAELDGAGPWRKLRDITLPLLRPTTRFVSVLIIVQLFQIFAEPYVMTRGGPLYATTSITLLMYQQGFRWWNLGSAAAIAFVLFALIIAATGLQELLRRRKSA
jgi:multiple sugar transport system permease protein